MDMGKSWINLLSVVSLRRKQQTVYYSKGGPRVDVRSLFEMDDEGGGLQVGGEWGRCLYLSLHNKPNTRKQ